MSYFLVVFFAASLAFWMWYLRWPDERSNKSDG